MKQNEIIKRLKCIIKDATLKYFFDGSIIGEYTGLQEYFSVFYIDIFLPFHVLEFHKNEKGELFWEYLENSVYDFKDVPVIFCQFFENHVKHVCDVAENYISKIDNIKNIEIVGDVHGENTTKLLITQNNHSKFIVYESNFSSDGKYRDTFVSVDNSFVNIFPKITKKNGFFKREYLPVEYSTQDEREIKKYYKNLGKLMPLFLLFRAIDLHSENMIVKIPYPVFFDYEYLFVPGARDGSVYDILWTGIITPDKEKNMSILLGGYEDYISYTVPILYFKNEKPFIKRKTKSRRKINHIPRIGEKKVDSKKYLSNIIEGYKTGQIDCMKKVDSIHKKIKSMSILFVRLIVRPTRVYVALMKDIQLKILSEPGFSVDNFISNKLRELPLILTTTRQETIFLYEKKCIKKGIIPSFYTDIFQKSIFTPEGSIVSSLPESCFNIWEKYIKTYPDFVEKQKDILKKYMG